MVFIRVLGSLRLTKSSAFSAHRIAPLLFVCEFGQSIAIKRAVIEDAACRFEPTFSINERVVAAVGNVDTKMANLVIEFLAVDSADNAYKNSNFHFCSPFQSVSKTFNVRGLYPRSYRRISKLKID